MDFLFFLLVQWKVEMLIYLLTAEQIYFPNDKTIRNITQTFFIRLLKVFFVMISVVIFCVFLYVLLKLAMYSISEVCLDKTRINLFQLLYGWTTLKNKTREKSVTKFLKRNGKTFCCFFSLSIFHVSFFYQHKTIINSMLCYCYPLYLFNENPDEILQALF